MSFAGATRANLDLCLDNCPDGFFVNVDAGEYVCVKQCSEVNKPYTQGVYCTDQCTNGHVLLGKECVLECPDGDPVDGVCQDNCIDGENKYHYGGECIKSCSENSLYEKDHKCYDSIPEGLKLLEIDGNNRKLVDSCQSASEKMKYEYKGVCQVDCGTLYADGYQCIDEVPAGKYILEDGNFRRVVDRCPSNRRYLYDNTCISDCGMTEKKEVKNGVCTAKKKEDSWKKPAIALIVITIILVILFALFGVFICIKKLIPIYFILFIFFFLFI